MSNPALNRLLRSGGLTEFRVGAHSAPRRDGPVMFTGSSTHQTFSAAKVDDSKDDSKDYSKKENREGPMKKKQKKEGDDDSGSDSDDGPHFKSKVPEKGSDGDSDGKKNEGKNKKKPSFADKDKNGKPDFMEKKK